ncbi:NAD-dependent epimerase/dehydratase family protein [Leptospira idonii]|uniref:NAD-dependent epimerase/dehydratase family protein n=1 Tax=Leptospira idonii TaxID=1193500 RepID=A0A4R9LYS1_9LEPT|nr:NAD-dependent epimerase/dehydratase family protein [Leptospira idonii]TGN18872.1 NAD-dependent epimerase/dehydratase family protein [Leptospira idonii]
MKEFRVLLLGGTGLVGSHVLKSLPFYSEISKLIVWARVSKVPLNRDPIEVQNVSWEALKDGAIPFPDSIDAVVCCLGTTISKAGSQEKFREIDYEYPLFVAKAAKAAGVKAFLIVTAIGSDPDSKIFYNRVKGETERDLISLGFPYLGIFRPSLLLGEREELRLGEKVGEFLSFLFPFPLFGLKRYQPIRADLVAMSLLKALVRWGNLTEKPESTLEIFESDMLQDFGQGK